jgi:hypothetical protein
MSSIQLAVAPARTKNRRRHFGKGDDSAQGRTARIVIKNGDAGC